MLSPPGAYLFRTLQRRLNGEGSLFTKSMNAFLFLCFIIARSTCNFTNQMHKFARLFSEVNRKSVLVSGTLYKWRLDRERGLFKILAQRGGTELERGCIEKGAK